MPNHESIRMRYDLRMAAESEEAEIIVYGEICDVFWKRTSADMSASDFDKLIKDAKAKGAKRLTIRINCPGGDVNHAVAMRAIMMRSGMDEITVMIEGLCASSATLLPSIPGVKVRMYEGSEFMIHNPRSGARGTAKDLEAEAVRLRNAETEVAAIYARRTGRDETEIRAKMDAETWMTAKEAKDFGFVDEIIEAEPIVACVSPRMMAAMRGMYAAVPESVAEKEVSTAPEAVAAEDASENYNHEEERETMEIKDLTLDQLRDQNPELFAQVMKSGSDEERQRLQDIDDLTPPGYEEMAAAAKANGTTAMDYNRQIVKAQRERAGQFMSARQQELAPAAKVPGNSAEEANGKNDEQELMSVAKEIAGYAKTVREQNGGMY